MFGLKEQVIAGLLALALFVLAGGVMYMRHIATQNTRLHEQTALLKATVKGHEQAEAALREADEQKEAAYAQNARDRAALAAQLRDSRQKYMAMLAVSPEVRTWADVGLPAGIAHRMRARNRERATAGHQGDTAGGAAAGNAQP